MLARLREEDGMIGIIELMAAVMVLSVALLALMAGYDTAFVSLHKASQQSAATTLAQNQLELYSALQYSAIGLDTSTLNSVKLSDTTYTADEAALFNASSAVDATITGCGTATQCLPVQTLTGNDRRSYRVETFIRDVTQTGISRTERFVTVIVRDPGVSGSPIVAKVTSAFDSGPAS
jgi:Tfp pilus assembly protein PilV